MPAGPARGDTLAQPAGRGTLSSLGRGLAIALSLGATLGCAPACPAWDARGDGPCNLILGDAWDGRACVAISGCGCVGADCDRLRGDDGGAFCRAHACDARADAAGPSD